MIKKLITAFLITACAFGLLSCQSAPQPPAPEPQAIEKTPEPSVPFSKGPSGPPSVKGPTAPPPETTTDVTLGAGADTTPQAVTEKESGTFALPQNN